jgi:threonine-phosphate decarboxylase
VSGHGGNIWAASRATGIPEEEILDFSASINPLGVPKKAADALKAAIDRLCHYPEPYSESLSEHLGHLFGVDVDSIICGNGSAELIYLLPRALKPARVIILEPTFSEYERACRIAGTSKKLGYRLKRENNFDVSPETFAEKIIEACGSGGKAHRRAGGSTGPGAMAFLCNPNNPTGRLVARNDVLAIAETARQRGCYLVVDEAFLDFCPGESVLAEVKGNPFLIVVRSMTKFYALSGLRIGYALMHPSVARLVRPYKEPWTVNVLAQKAAIEVTKDVSFQKASLAAMAEEKSFLEGELRKLRIEFVPSRANYYLLRLDRALEVKAALQERGILVRDCSNFVGLGPGFLRIAVRSRRENEILMAEMEKICAPLS